MGSRVVPSYKYDVAFSFTKDDESLANTLNDLLRDRVSTFIYSEHQMELAGRDGEEVFNRVFGTEARVVVVVYRSSWGATPWTRVEETAIRNRGFEEGYDFVILIPTESNAVPPKWLPKNRIWIGLERWGVDAAASVIDARVQEAGGTPQEDTLATKASRLKREIEGNEARRNFLGSQQGVDAAKLELTRLSEAIKQRAVQFTDEALRLTFRFEKDDRGCAIYSHEHTVTIRLSLQWSNSLDQSSLYVKLWKGGVPLRGPRFSASDEPEELKELDYDVDYDPESNSVGWKLNRKGSPFLATSQLADACIELLLDRIGKRRLS